MCGPAPEPDFPKYCCRRCGKILQFDDPGPTCDTCSGNQGKVILHVQLHRESQVILPGRLP